MSAEFEIHTTRGYSEGEFMGGMGGSSHTRRPVIDSSPFTESMFNSTEHMELRVVSDRERVVICEVRNLTTKVVHTGTARCCPSDTFDINIGIALAKERALDKHIQDLENEILARGGV